LNFSFLSIAAQGVLYGCSGSCGDIPSDSEITDIVDEWRSTVQDLADRYDEKKQNTKGGGNRLEPTSARRRKSISFSIESAGASKANGRRAKNMQAMVGENHDFFVL
jgi:hypothetical protein